MFSPERAWVPLPCLMSVKVPAPSEMTPETIPLLVLAEAPNCKAWAPVTLDVTLPAACSGADTRIGMEGPPP